MPQRVKWLPAWGSPIETHESAPGAGKAPGGVQRASQRGLPGLAEGRAALPPITRPVWAVESPFQALERGGMSADARHHAPSVVIVLMK